MTSALRFLTSASFACFAAAQSEWQRPEGPARLTGRFGVQLANDALRARVVLFGGRDFGGPNDETWEWDGGAWSQRLPQVRPSARAHHALAWDAVRGRVLLFGGFGVNGAPLGDLWEWDGVAWTPRVTIAAPTARGRAAMTHDAARGRTVLFGGDGANGAPVADAHWEWDGTAWIQGPGGPPPRSAAGLAYDVVRARTVLFGGGTSCLAFTCPTLGDTWEFDGVAWTQRIVTGPPARRAAGMTFDAVRNRVVLTGGEATCMPACATVFTDTWDWDGTQWSPTANGAPQVHSGGLAYDVARATTVAFGGVAGAPMVSQWLASTTHGFAGAAWSQLAGAAMPPATTNHAMVFDGVRNRVVWCGSPGNVANVPLETWEWDGFAWSRLLPASSPPPRVGHAMSFDAARQRAVLFGGNAAAPLGDTWEWDGANWTQRQPLASPPGQYGHRMAFDSARNVTVLYPGALAGSSVHEYDGVTWTQRPAAVEPPFRHRPALAYDSRRARTVLFGGLTSSANDDTWEWDGTAWTSVGATVRPPARSSAAVAFDDVRGRIVLFGGTAGGTALGDLWEWDGAQWRERVLPPGPGARAAGALAYDRARGRALLFGGNGGVGSGAMHDTWELLVPCDRAGPGEVSGAGLPLGCTTAPRLGTTFCVGFVPSPGTSGVELLLVAAGPCAGQPAFVPPPLACAPSSLYALPALALAATGNPATFCFALPPNPVFVGAALCLQGASLESSACLRATDGLVVVVR